MLFLRTYKYKIYICRNNNNNNNNIHRILGVWTNVIKNNNNNNNSLFIYVLSSAASGQLQSARLRNDKNKTNTWTNDLLKLFILSRVLNTKDGVRIGKWIYWPLTDRNYNYL
jgi:hypothetical protein